MKDAFASLFMISEVGLLVSLTEVIIYDNFRIHEHDL